MRTQTLLFILCPAFYLASAQENRVTITTEQNSDRSVSLYANNRTMADYSVKLVLTLSGYSVSGMGNPAVVRSTPGRTKIATLFPTGVNPGSSFRYSYTTYPGAPFSRKSPGDDILYLLPGTPGSSLEVVQIISLAKTLGQDDPGNFNSTGFRFTLGDTICAARAGTVFAAQDDIKEGEKANQTFSHNRNRIAVMHKDGTISTYSILAPIQSLVSEGDDVVPGQPIAVLNRESDKYTLLFSVSYVDEKKALSGNIETGRPVSPYQYMAPRFYTGDNGAEPLQTHKMYTAARNNDIIGKELSKKEKKKLGLQ